MRSPVRASILPNRGRATASGDPVGWETGRRPEAQATAPILDSTFADFDVPPFSEANSGLDKNRKERCE
jgi:hypothetical protein